MMNFRFAKRRKARLLFALFASAFIALLFIRSQHQTISPPYRFILYNNAVCSYPNGTFASGDLLVLVKSTPKHSRHRAAIRATWAKPCWTKQFKNRYKVLFVLGKHVGENQGIVHGVIQLEFLNHQDIVQYDYPDTYRLTTRKLLAAWSFAKFACPLFRYIFIVDEDFIVNPKLLMTLTMQIPEAAYNSYIGGHLYPMSRPYRDNRSRYYISSDEYPYPVFPPFVAGGFVLLSMPIATRLLHNLLETQIFLPLDDVTIGLALRRIGVKPVNIRNICIHMTQCRRVKPRERIAMHGFTNPKYMLSVWRQFNLSAVCQAVH